VHVECGRAATTVDGSLLNPNPMPRKRPGLIRRGLRRRFPEVSQGALGQKREPTEDPLGSAKEELELPRWRVLQCSPCTSPSR
jgi:hypothetical protein